MTRIAVVEDNEDNRLLLEVMLGDRFDLDAYASGSAALEGMTERRPDLVLMDISLPEMDGVEVLRRLRESEALRTVPVIALTAHSMTGDREKFLGLGFDGYVSKPIVDQDAFVGNVAAWIETGRNGRVP